MILRAGAAVLLALAAAPLFAQEISLEDELRVGRDMFEKGRYDQAERHFQLVRAHAPRAWHGHAYLAMTLVQKAVKARDPRLRKQHLEAAARAKSGLVKSAGLRFTDPLCRFLDGIIKSVGGDVVRAQAIMAELMRLPEDRFAPYDELPLLPNVQQAYAQTSVALVNRMIFVGSFNRADTLLRDVEPHVRPDGTMRLNFERQSAVVDEHLGRVDDAIDHLHRCIALLKDEPKTRQDLQATIVMMMLQHKRFDEARKLLATLPADSKSPEVIAARCMSHYHAGRRDPQGAAADAAIAYHREVLPSYPVHLAYFIVEQFADLVLARVDRRSAAKERALLEFTVGLAKKQLEIRPECPRLYYALYQLYRLLGDEKMEIRYQNQHRERKAAWGDKKHYDESGRPRCR